MRGHFVTLLENVVEFRVFYRFDDVAYAAGASGATNAVPFGGSIRDAAAINAMAGAIDPWNYVVAAMVCLTVQTDEIGISVNTTTTVPTCPTTAAEAETGVGSGLPPRRTGVSAARFRRYSPCATVPRRLL